MKSLHRRMLVSLCVAVSIVGAVSAVVAYRQVDNETRELLDHQQEQIADIAAQTVDGPAPELDDDDEDIEVAVWDVHDNLQYSSMSGAAMPLITGQGFTEMILGGKPYRVYTATVAGRHIEVAQPVDARDDQAEAAALSALLPVLILLPVLAGVIVLVIRTLLKPLREVAAAVARREPFSPEALQARALPAEVAPLLDEINRLLERQREAVQRERNFLTDAAHALRTPLSALQLQADVLDGSADPAERRARLAALRGGIRRATHLAEQLLTLARIETAADGELRMIDLDAALTEVKTLYEPVAAAAGIRLNAEAHSCARVRADHRKITLICGNLLDNALRFTPEGGSIALLAETKQGHAQIEICDEGPGLEPQELERVLERFHRTSADAGAVTGLGLATVDSLVKQLGGHVSLHNRTDRSGLIARVILPRAEADAA